MFIGGKWVDSASGKTFETINPATGEVICQVAEGDKADIDKAVKAARKAFESGPWSKMSAAERGRLMFKLADAIEKNIEELAALESLDNGKPYRDALTADLPLTSKCYRYYAGWADKNHGKTIPVEGNYFTYTRHEPIGVVGQIIPWNFPLLMQAWKWGPALACGNTVVLKPAEQTPLTALRVAQLAQDVGFPDGVVNVVYGGGDVGERLVTHPGVDGVGFVGSHATAERIVRAAGLKRTLIEASGNGPVIVCEDAELDRAAEGAVFGGFFCAGQVCCATERVLVHERVHDDFLDEVLKAAAAWPLGDPLDDSTRVGPMNNEPTAEKMDRHLEDAVAKGASVVLGGSRAGDRPTRLYYEPTVVTDVGVNQHETFGPIVPLIRVRSDDEALAVANDSHLGLQAAVYTSSLKRAFQYVDNLRVGNVVVNDSTDYWEAQEPFGGASGTQSGWGRIGGRYTMLDMSDLKTVVLDVGGLE